MYSTMRAICLLLAVCFAGVSFQDKPYRGVIDQKEADFVLVDHDTMETIAVLKGRGFDKENFARFVGDPVEVRGTLEDERGVKVLYVRAIGNIKRIPVPKK